MYVEMRVGCLQATPHNESWNEEHVALLKRRKGCAGVDGLNGSGAQLMAGSRKDSRSI